MLRLIAVLRASVLVLAACSSRSADPGAGSAASAGATAERQAGKGSDAASAAAAGEAGAGAGVNAAAPGSAAGSDAAPAGSSQELVQRSAGKTARVAPADLSIPGVELFAVTFGAPSEAEPGALVGVAGGKVVEGSELMRAVIAQKPAAAALARVALRVARNDGELLAAPASPEQRKAKVRAPAITGNALVFWVSTLEAPRLLQRGRLDLVHGVLELTTPTLSRDQMIDYALIALSGTNPAAHDRAIKMLADLCATPRARHGLLGALSNHPRPQTRAAIADVAHRCGGDAVNALIDSMQNDKAAMVRPRAASALGRIGDKRARPALAKAAKSEDANLSWAANQALKKLQ